MPVTGHGPASSTVTRSTMPSSVKTWVIPSLRARIAAIVLGEPDLDVHAGGQVVEALERVDRLRRGLVDVDEPLVGPDLEVLLRVLVLERRADHGVDVLLGRKRHGTGHRRTRTGGGVDDLLGRRLDGRVVVRLEADPDLVLSGCGHCRGGGGHGARPWSFSPSAVPRAYWMISVTTPEPTVRPPSRMAKRRPWSMAIGWMSSISIWTLSPGMTISVPSGRCAEPVTSVVRK